MKHSQYEFQVIRAAAWSAIPISWLLIYLLLRQAAG